jgi:hypothetical protein
MKCQITRYKEIKGASGTRAAEKELCSANTDSSKYSYGFQDDFLACVEMEPWNVWL